MQRHRLNLYLLGSPQIELDNQPIDIRLQKALALLFLLAIDRQNHWRDTLATFFWPNCSQGQARSYLRNALWVLKESLGEGRLLAHREVVGLYQQNSYYLDVEAFQEHLQSVNHHRALHSYDDLCQNCLENLMNAVNLYRDDFLSGFTLRDSPAFDEWQSFHCEDLRQRFGEALEKLALWHAGQGNYSSAITFALRLVLLDPLNESPRRILMESFFKSGHRADALQQYQDYLHVLKRELNISPSIEIKEFYNAIKSGSPDFTGSLDLRTATSEAVIQPFKAESLPGTFSTFSIIEPPIFIPPFSFPKPPPFVKREQELEKLENLLQASINGQGNSAFISGGAGSGKTTLALEFIRRAQEKFPSLIVSGGNCLPYTSQGNPYSIFQDMLTLLAGEVEQRWAGGILTGENLNRLFAFLPTALQILIDTSPDLVSAFIPSLNLSSKVWAYKNQGPNTASLLVKLLLQDFYTENPRNLDQELIFTQNLKALQAISAQRPLLLLLDDLHWADPSSIRLLSYLLNHTGHNRIMLLGTYCPQKLERDWQAQDSTLKESLDSLGRLDNDHWIDLDQALQREGQSFTNAYLSLETSHLSERAIKEIYRITANQPLFLDEYLHEIKENGALYRDEENYWADSEDLFDHEKQPGCLDAVIEARLNRLSQELRRAVEVASVAGIEFSIEVVASVLQMEFAALIQLFMSESNHQGIVIPLGLYQSGPHHLSWFRFRHSLFQKVLYNQLSEPERMFIHGEIGASMERIYGKSADKVSNQLAWQFEQAGNIDKAAYYIKKATERALRLGVFL